MRFFLCGTIIVFLIAIAFSATGTGSNYKPSYVTITGGGAIPDTANGYKCNCDGTGATDATSCLQAAANTAASQKKPLLIPYTSKYYKITKALNINCSIIGIGGMPTIKQTATSGTIGYAGLSLATNMTGWIYNLHIVGFYNGSNNNGEWAPNIAINQANGVTIKGCLLENAMGDNIWDANSKPAGARNVLVDGNTLLNPYRCIIGLTGVADRWAIINNLSSKQTSGQYDWEGNAEDSYITNIEMGYNKVSQRTIDNPKAVPLAISGMWDSTPGGNLYNHHNYGTWPNPTQFLQVWAYQGSSLPQYQWQNIVSLRNIQGNLIPCVWDSSASVQTGGNFSFTFTYGNPAEITYPKKPSWINAVSNNPTISGTAPAIPRQDTVVVSAKINGSSDTLRLYIYVSNYYTIEAESGTLTAPMQKENDPSASGGQYITTPAGTGNTISPQTEATYTFNAPSAGNYYVWLKVYVPSINPTANYGTFYGFNGKFIKPGSANRTAGLWEYIMSATPNALSAGANQLILGHGNEQVKIDQIYLTTTPNPQLPDKFTGLLPKHIKNISQQKQNLSIRITPNGGIQFLSGTAGLEGIHLSIRDILGREIGSNGMVWKPGNLKISNGVYFVLLQQKNGLDSEIGRFTLAK